LKFLVDQCLAAEVADGLVAAGHDAVHVSAHGMSRADDAELFARAAEEQRVLVSADTDFGGLLASPRVGVPSVVLYRGRSRRRPSDQVRILLANLPAVEDDLVAGAIVIIEDASLGVRSLPFI
jgi:predicted nuclease of predicted toxin-antitoxin system